VSVSPSTFMRTSTELTDWELGRSSRHRSVLSTTIATSTLVAAGSYAQNMPY